MILFFQGGFSQIFDEKPLQNEEIDTQLPPPPEYAPVIMSKITENHPAKI